MTESLQNLLDRIEQDGVQKAEAEARRIVDEARAKAAAMIEKAGQDAAASVAEADEAAKAYEVRAGKALELAARDVVLAVEAAVTRLFEHLAERGTAAALEGEVLAQAVGSVVEAYCKADRAGGHIELAVAPAQKKAIQAYLEATFADRLREGITVTPDDGVTAGFTVRLADGHVEHNFTADAIADALGELVRPELAAIIKNAHAS